jgi:phosphonate transport system substrate-binding protein
MSRPLSFVLGLLLLCSSCGSEPQADTGPELLFTAIPDDNATELRARMQPLADYLAEQLGVTVRYIPVANYSASVDAFKNGDVLLAWFGGLTGVQARAAVPGSQAIAQGVVDPVYKSYFIANARTGIEPGDSFPATFEGTRFTFGSESSTSGRLMPEHFIRTFSGRAPEEFFGSANSYSGSHDKTALLVQAGTFETGALSYKTYDKLVAEGRIDPALCRVVWETPVYADYNWTAHPRLDEQFGAGFTTRLQAALVSLESPELLGALLRPEGLIEASNEDFESLSTLARQLGFLR